MYSKNLEYDQEDALSIFNIDHDCYLDELSNLNSKSFFDQILSISDDVPAKTPET